MERSLYKYTFSRTNAPDWMCPTCKKGILRIVDDSFRAIESRDSRQAHGHPEWDPSGIDKVYSCILKCNNEKCQEVVSSTGRGGADIEGFYGIDDVPDQRWVDYYYPTFFDPPLTIIDIPASCPTEVAKPLQESFRLFFCSPASAGNNVRMAIESLLTQLGVPTLDTRSKRSKPQRLTLKARLTLLSDEHSEFNTLFDAIRLFGNDGSHPDSKITTDDVMDAYEIIEHVLQVLYQHNADRAIELAQKMAQSFRPV